MRRRVMLSLCVLLLIVLTIGSYGCKELEDITGAAEDAVKDIEQNIDKVEQSAGQQPDVQPHPETGDTRGQTLTEYFGEEEFYFYRQTNSSTIYCESGNCPQKTGIRDEIINDDCFFCDQSSEVYDDKLIVHITPAFVVDTFAGCTTDSNFNYPGELKIIEKTDKKIVAEGTGTGNVEQYGDSCEETYTYRFETDETWIFTTHKLESDSVVKATIDGPGNVIAAPGWSNPQSSPRPYSQYSMTVTCSSPHGFKVKPDIKVIKVNGYDASISIHIDREEINEATVRYKFAANFNADYTVVGVCRTYGKNGALLDEKYSNDEFVVMVRDSPQGDLPEDRYK
jgi:hypothetical protein